MSSSTSMTTAGGGKVARRDGGGKAARRRPAAPSYPLDFTLRNFAEVWMAYPAAVVLIASAVARYFQLIGTPLLFAIPLLLAVALVSVRFPRNRRRLRHNRQAYFDELQRQARYRSLAEPARAAADQLSGEKNVILEKSAASGQNLEHVLEKLDEYERDYVDLLYLYQERARTLKTIRAQDFEAARRTVAEERAALESRQDKTSQTYRRTVTALEQQEALIGRQEQVAADLDASLGLIKQQARNIQSMFSLVSAQVTAMPLGTTWGADFSEFEALSDSIQMTKEMLNSAGDSY